MTAPAQNITEDTIAQIAKAQTTGIMEPTGIYSYDLSGLVQLIPVVTPFRDVVPRVKSPDGNPMAVWRALLDATASQPDPAIGFDYAGSEVVFNEQDFQARYKPLAYASIVTQDAFDLAQNYGDPYAIAAFNTLNQMLIAEDRKLLGAQSFPLARPAAPVPVVAASGGSIPASTTMYVGVAARTGSGYYFGSGNSQGNSAQVGTISTTGSSVTATVAAVRGAVAYDWFQSANGTTWYYYTTTTTNTVTMTKVITSNQALPPGTQCPDLSRLWLGLAPGQSTTVNGVTVNYTGPATLNLAADNGSGNQADYDGFMASLAGDYNGTGQWSTPGTGTANPSIWASLDGAPLHTSGGTITEIEQGLFLPLFTQVKCSPTAIMVSPFQAQEIANQILTQPSAVTYLNTDESGRVNVTAGGRIGALINAPAGGIPVPIEVHTSLPPGTIIARTDRVPFPQAGITNVIECRTLRDTAQFDYGVSRIGGQAGGGPRRESEIRTVSAFVSRAPVAMGVLSNVG